MYEHDATAVAVEFKFASDPSTGEFEGYGAIFGSTDAHGDLIQPGAFKDTLAKRAADGRSLPMYAQHGPHVGGDHLPVGVWKSVAEDGQGLKMAGQIAGMDTERGKVIHSLVKSRALAGLSIEYNVPRGGAIYGTDPGQPKRIIKAVDLYGISLVAEPSHPLALVQSIKSASVMMGSGDRDKAVGSIAGAMALHAATLAGGNSPTADERAQMLEHLQDAHEALTGRRIPNGASAWIKSAPTIREFEEFLREKKFSRSEATQLAERVFKSAPRDEGLDQAIQPSVKSALDAFHAVAAGFPASQS